MYPFQTKNIDLIFHLIKLDFYALQVIMAECNFDFDFDFDDHSSEETNTVPKNHRAINKENTPTGASTNPKKIDLNKNLNMNLI